MLRKVANLFNLVAVSVRTHGISRMVYWTVFGYMNVNEFVVFVADPKRPAAGPKTPGLEIKVTDGPGLELIQKDSAFQTREAFIDRYRKSSACLIGFYGGAPAHVMWVFRRGDDSRFFDLSPEEAEINYCFTAPGFRGKGIYTAMISGAVELLGRQGVERVYMATHSTNVPAIRAIRRAGFREAGRMRHYGIVYRPRWKRQAREGK